MLNYICLQKGGMPVLEWVVRLLKHVRDEVLRPALYNREFNLRNLIGENGIIANVIVYLREIGIYSEI